MSNARTVTLTDANLCLIGSSLYSRRLQTRGSDRAGLTDGTQTKRIEELLRTLAIPYAEEPST